MKEVNTTQYALLDSGNGEKLEQFGSRTLARPSSVCLWKKRTPDIWKQADATYVPDQGWKFKGKAFESWVCEVLGCSLQCMLQSNGQVGFFPEHALYLKDLTSEKPKRVLNLFAYTGLATTYFAKAGADVVHVDLSKKALTWAKQNLELNNIDPQKVRLIPEDTSTFLKREIKRKNVYNVVIIDPPTFSRTSKEKFWKLGDVLAELASDCSQVLVEQGTFVLTCHDPGLTSDMLFNVCLDVFGNRMTHHHKEELVVKEQHSQRCMPAGSFVKITL